jgi:hypothetical protein
MPILEYPRLLTSNGYLILQLTVFSDQLTDDGHILLNTDCKIYILGCKTDKLIHQIQQKVECLEIIKSR